MKLKNKKTGEILHIGNIIVENPNRIDCGKLAKCSSLAELNDEWEDAPEEPKKHYEILAMGAVMEREDAEDEIFRNQGQREIGNYFDTREEAELAICKLKAWKRLKDKGFRFIDHIDRDIGQGITRYEWNGYIDGEDLDLLFCTEEDD